MYMIYYQLHQELTHVTIISLFINLLPMLTL